MKQLKAHLEQTGNFVQGALDGLSSHIAIVDENCIIVFVNAAWRAFAVANGCDADAVGLGVDYLMVCSRAEGDDAADAQAAAEGIRSVLESRSAFFSMEYSCHSPEEKRWFLMRVTGFHFGERRFAILANENITQAKLDEIRSRESEDKFRKSFTASPCIMAVTVLQDGRYIDVNKSFEKVMGYSSEECLGKTSVEIGMWPDAAQHALFVQKILQCGRVDNYEVQLFTKDCQRLTVIMSSECIEFNGERHALIAWTDITVRKRLEQQLAYSNTSLLERTKALEDMNTTLRVLIEQRDMDRLDLEKGIQQDIRLLVLPYVERIRAASSEQAVLQSLSILQSNLNNITAGFARRLETAFVGLTSNEIKVADLVRSGMTSKEIARNLSISVPTADYYRRAIRAKLGLSKKKANLRTFLAHFHAQ